LKTPYLWVVGPVGVGFGKPAGAATSTCRRANTIIGRKITRIALAFKAGRNGFWLALFLQFRMAIASKPQCIMIDMALVVWLHVISQILPQ